MCCRGDSCSRHRPHSGSCCPRGTQLRLRVVGQDVLDLQLGEGLETAWVLKAAECHLDVLGYAHALPLEVDVLPSESDELAGTHTAEEGQFEVIVKHRFIFQVA